MLGDLQQHPASCPWLPNEAHPAHRQVYSCFWSRAPVGRSPTVCILLLALEGALLPGHLWPLTAPGLSSVVVVPPGDPPHGNPNPPEPSAPGGAIPAPVGPRPHPSVLRQLRPRSACARVAELRLSLPLGACGQGSCISGRSCRLQAWPCAWRLCGCGCRK